MEVYTAPSAIASTIVPVPVHLRSSNLKGKALKIHSS